MGALPLKSILTTDVVTRGSQATVGEVLHAMARDRISCVVVVDDERRPRGIFTERDAVALLFIESYRELPLLAWPRTLVDMVVELEELMVLWRTRHARMVERVIGRRVGTGGSSGVDYLDQTTKIRVFTELWTVRTLLLPKPALPPLRDAGAYGFAR